MKSIELSPEARGFVNKIVVLIEQQRMIETALSENIVQYIREEYAVDLKGGEWTLDRDRGILERTMELDSARPHV